MTRSGRTRTPAKAEQGLEPSTAGNSTPAETPSRTQPKRKTADSAAGSSAKKTKVVSQSDVPAASNTTPAGSGLRRSARSRTPRVVQEVSPGPALARTAKASATGKKASHCKQQQEQPPQPTSAAKSTVRSKRRRSEAAAAIEINEAGVQASAATEQCTQSEQAAAAGSNEQQQHLNSNTAIPPPSEGGAEGSSDASRQQPQLSHTVDDTSPQAAANPQHDVMQDTVTPSRPPPLKSPCTVPAEHGLPQIPHKVPASPVKPDTDMADASEPATAAAPNALSAVPNALPAALTLNQQPDASVLVSATEQSSQEDSRQSSGLSNDHPVIVPAKKHLNWDAAESLTSKPPTAQQASQAVAQATDTAVNEAWWDPTDVNKVQAVREVLHVAAAPTGQVPMCRQTQVADLQEFLGKTLQDCKGGSIYVSGVPGTGKSLVVHELARQCHKLAASSSKCSLAPAVVSINCMNLPTPQAIFQRILTGLHQAADQAPSLGDIIYPGATASETASSGGQALESLQAVLTQPLPSQPSSTPHKRTPSKRRAVGMLVVICDEMDQLMSTAQDVLYDLFFLPQLLRSRMVLIGIANSLDLTERLLPGLEARGCKPRLVAFPTYSRTQVATLLQERLDSLPGPAFAAMAVDFCSRKLAAANGDMRRALEACTAALELKVKEAAAEQADMIASGLTSEPMHTTILQPSEGTPAQLPSQESAAQAQAAHQPQHAQQMQQSQTGGQQGGAVGGMLRKPKLVGIGHMCRAINDLTGGVGNSSMMVQAIKNLPQQQQLLMCAATKLMGVGPQEQPALIALEQSPKVSKSPFAKKPPRDSTGSYNSATSSIGNPRDNFTSPKGRSKPPLGMSPCSSKKALRSPASRGFASSPGGFRSVASRPSGFRGTGTSPAKGGLGMTHDCSIGQLHDAYITLCRKVAFCPLTSGEVSAACSTLSDQGLLQLSSQQGDRRCRVTLRVQEDDVLAAVVDNRLLSNCLSL